MTPAARFAAFRAAAPRVPPETCPDVDKLQMSLSAIDGDLGRIREEMGLCGQRASKADLLGRIGEWEEELLDAEAGLAGAGLRLEELRKANEQLRESSLYWRQAAERLGR